MSAVEIRILDGLPRGQVQALRAEATAGGFAFLARLVQEYESGQNCFDRPGEALYGAFMGRCLIGICGLNMDPYTGDAAVGRVRRLYVAATHRRQGVGRQLVMRVIEQARRSFERLALRTHDAPAAAFYGSLGFTRAEDRADTTHVMDLGTA